MAASLGADGGLLNDNLADQDRDNLALVLAAVSHAGGSHEHTPTLILVDDAGNAYRNVNRERPGPPYLWPHETVRARQTCLYWRACVSGGAYAPDRASFEDVDVPASSANDSATEGPAATS